MKSIEKRSYQNIYQAFRSYLARCNYVVTIESICLAMSSQKIQALLVNRQLMTSVFYASQESGPISLNRMRGTANSALVTNWAGTRWQ